jgi:glutamine synthetase
MVGSSASVSGPNIVLNTIVAEVLKDIADELEGAEDFTATLNTIIERLVKAHSRIIFNGDGYAGEWLEEAERRGLPNIKSSVEAIKIFNDPEYVDLFLKHGVFFKGEIAARQEILFEEYAKTINIEALTMAEMAKKEIFPSVIEFATSLADSINSIKAATALAPVSVQENLLVKVSNLLVEAQEALEALEAEVKATHALGSIEEEAFAFKFKVFDAMTALRKPCDELEVIVAEVYWPYPTYSDLLFRV